jgi:hypothetical protein
VAVAAPRRRLLQSSHLIQQFHVFCVAMRRLRQQLHHARFQRRVFGRQLLVSLPQRGSSRRERRYVRLCIPSSRL